ncbi:MAG: GNAT family N-acetyltransferase [Microbacteriaceae bacterium]
MNNESDLAPARAAFEALAADFTLVELPLTAAEDVCGLDQLTYDDYPVTPQNAPERRTLVDVRALWERGARLFGAYDDSQLVAVTVIDQDGEHAETDFTAVAPTVRGRGLAAAVKAASVLALTAEGVRTFGTGGAAVNEASIRMNEAIGYTIEERWVSLTPPGERQASAAPKRCR